MRTLALETSTREASIALADDAAPGLELRMPSSERTAVWLAGAVEQGLAQLDWPRHSIELVALTSGPGSFTGLRIGVTTAKMIAYAWEIPLIALDTLTVIAHQSDHQGLLSVVMDARRNEVFVARFACGPDREARPIEATRVMTDNAWITSLAENEVMAVSGPGLEKLGSLLPEAAQAVASDLRYPCASTVAEIGIREFARGNRTDPWTLVPQYFRKSYAERSLS